MHTRTSGTHTKVLRMVREVGVLVADNTLLS